MDSPTNPSPPAPKAAPTPRRATLLFFVRTVAWLLPLLWAWTQVAPWLAQPVATMAHMALEFWASDWFQSAHKTLLQMDVQTRLTVSAAGRVGRIVAHANPASTGYGLPLLWALLLAAGGPNRLGKLIGGSLLLLPAQAFSLTLDLLKQMTMAMPGGAPALGINQWQFEAISLGYQLGALLVPTLVPILLWLWLDQAKARKLLLNQ